MLGRMQQRLISHHLKKRRQITGGKVERDRP
jgi:hypothetical protein